MSGLFSQNLLLASAIVFVLWTVLAGAFWFVFARRIIPNRPEDQGD